MVKMMPYIPARRVTKEDSIMHPFVQTVLVVGVLALVGIGGFVAIYGIPEREPEMSAMDRLEAASARAKDTHCRFLLSRGWDELNADGRADRVRCLARN